jgi:putative sigma-54 modulation protein
MVEFTIKGKNIDITQPVRAYVTRKMAKIARYMDTMAVDGVVEIGHEATRDSAQRYVAQVTIGANHSILRGEARSSTLRSAVDAVAEVMQRQAARYKGKVYHKGKVQSAKGAASDDTTFIDEDADELEDLPTIVKTKHFAVKPMQPEEAAEQMELLGHDFYVFLNDRSSRVNVVYRRRDGNYGLIEPETT